MGKIKFMAEEFFRSFRKNLFKNVLLMVMFSTSMVMTVLMGSYYLDLGERNPDTPSYQGDGTWHLISIIADDTTDMDDSTDTVQGCRNIMDYYERLHDSKEHPFFSVDTVIDCYVRQNDFRELFGDKGYDGFLSEEHPGAEMAYFGAEEDGDVCNVLTLKCAKLEANAFEVFGLRTEEGEGFSENNLTIQNAADPIPVVLGNEYKGIISVGETIDIAFLDYAYSCRVAGILEKGSMIPEQGDGAEDMVLLDSRIIFPYTVRVLEDTDELKEIAKYAVRDLDHAHPDSHADRFYPLRVVCDLL